VECGNFLIVPFNEWFICIASLRDQSINMTTTLVFSSSLYFHINKRSCSQINLNLRYHFTHEAQYMATSNPSAFKLVLGQSGIMVAITKELQTKDLFRLAVTSKATFVNLASIDYRFTYLRKLIRCLCGNQILTADSATCSRCFANICSVSKLVVVTRGICLSLL